MRQSRLLVGVILILFVYSLLVVVRNFAYATSPGQGIDFYSYWMPLQAVREGVNPYIPNLSDIIYPSFYLDGEMDHLGLRAQFDKPVPANSPLMLCLLYPLGFFTFEVARFLWMVVNYLLTVGSVFVLLRLFEHMACEVGRRNGLILLLVALSMLAVRTANGNGQTTLLIVFALFSSCFLHRHQKDLSAGLLLGIALSKYTLAIGPVAYFLYKKKWSTLMVAIATQVFGVVAVALLSQTNPVGLAIDYVRLVSISGFTSMPGIHLAHYLPFSQAVVAAGVTILFAVALFLIHRRHGASDSASVDTLVFALSINWSILAVYHRYYDATILLFGVALMMAMVANPQCWNLTPKQRNTILGLLVVSTTLLMLPGETIQRLLPGGLYAMIKSLPDVAATTIVIVWSVAFWLVSEQLAAPSKRSL